MYDNWEGLIMCGIGGYADFKNRIEKNENIIKKMCETLKRRGPDQIGFYSNEYISFAHRRLSVIDTQHGVQPMKRSAGCQNFIITYNGELYNSEDLRKKLIQIGYIFTEKSDTEVLLFSYIEWGEKCVEKLNGIFAFAIYDEQNKKIFAARDRAGVKPFFYSIYKDTFIFGSEIKTVLAHPMVESKINNVSLAEIFLIGPGRTSGTTPFLNIFELCPGECCVFSENGLSKKNYWKLSAYEHTDSFDTTKDRIRELIWNSVSGQTVSDVPLCCFLSGGLDSSIITAICAKKFCPNTLTTYSVDYQDNSKFFTASAFQPNSDSEYISLVSEMYKTNHNTVTINNFELSKALSEATKARDLPCMADVDSSLLLFCRQVKKTHTVALSGECADEIFGGYPWFRNEAVLWKNDFPWSGNIPLKASFLKQDILNFSPTEYVQQKYSDTIHKAPTLPTDSKIDKRIREITFLNINWFMQGLLDRKDRMSMYSGLEVRVPFCDHRILEYAYNIPWEIKNFKEREKGLVREAFSPFLPQKIVWRKKSPYPKTHNPIYFNAVKKLLKEILDNSNAPIWNYADKQSLKTLYETDGKIFDVPWYGQLMTAPQIFAYFFSVNYWLEQYNPTFVK